MANKKCKVRPEIINVNSNEPNERRTNETRHIKWHETCKCECRLDASVCHNKQWWMMINLGANVKNWLIKVYEIKDMLRILLIVNVTMINHAMLVNIWIMKIVNVEKGF